MKTTCLCLTIVFTNYTKHGECICILDSDAWDKFKNIFTYIIQRFIKQFNFECIKPCCLL